MRRNVSFTACGDFLAARKLPETYDGFAEVRDFIARGDARYFNFEMVLADHTCWGNQYYGGAYVRAQTSVLESIKSFGFNAATFANNHSMDFGYEGLLQTLDHLKNAGLPVSGAGRNLDEAAAPAFLETPRGSFGVIGVVSTMMNPAAMAGRQSRRVPGRPGVNGLRVSDSVVVTPEEFDVLDRIIRKSKMNGQWDISRAEGFRPPLPEGTLNFRETTVEKGEETRYVTHPNEKDMQRIERNIISARSQCDCVLVTMHSHEVGLDDKELPADFYIEFAHRCIDAGASAVIGHGPHILRRVEMYKGRPIFYCLGNFVFREEAQESYPEDMYEKYGVTSDTTIEELALLRTDHHRRGLLMNPKVLEAVIPYVELENDEVKKIELYPVSLGAELEYWQMGLPRPGFGRGILERLNALSVPYGTEIRIRKDGIGEIVL